MVNFCSISYATFAQFSVSINLHIFKIVYKLSIPSKFFEIKIKITNSFFNFYGKVPLEFRNLKYCSNAGSKFLPFRFVFFFFAFCSNGFLMSQLKYLLLLLLLVRYQKRKILSNLNMNCNFLICY